MTKHTLPRTGKSPVAFDGDLIAETKSPLYRRHLADPHEKANWFEIAVYKTVGGSYVAHVAYRWAGKLFREVNRDHVEVSQTVGYLLDLLAAFDSTRCVGGFPQGREFAEKQRKLLETVAEDWRLAIEDIGQKLLAQGAPEILE